MHSPPTAFRYACAVALFAIPHISGATASISSHAGETSPLAAGMAESITPNNSWDSHVHCFNPAKHPFKPSRSYTPEAAPLSALVASTYADRIMMVQASIEDGPENLIDNLNEGRAKYPEKLFRGTIFADPEPGRALEKLLGPDDFARFHAAGVRSIRIHGSYGGNGDNATWVREQFRRAAQLEGVARYGWSLSAQLSLRMWAAVADFLLHDEELRNVRIIADHNGSVTPEDVSSPEFDAFLGLLSAGRLSVKIGALHRRAPDDFHRMRTVVGRLAASSPTGIVWGSDWPHVDSTQTGESPSPPLPVDTAGELRALKSWLSEEQWNSMLSLNPNRLFDM
ncbi:uncharacterized protein PG998_001161 [Apiospora kogelbergensis]|uniref:uncharacterized protein n=1 Tax=Apiospora kogelbergensis TaxID=1337665 RepID=UPI0031315313